MAFIFTLRALLNALHLVLVRTAAKKEKQTQEVSVIAVLCYTWLSSTTLHKQQANVKLH